VNDEQNSAEVACECSHQIQSYCLSNPLSLPRYTHASMLISSRQATVKSNIRTYSLRPPLFRVFRPNRGRISSSSRSSASRICRAYGIYSTDTDASLTPTRHSSLATTLCSCRILPLSSSPARIHHPSLLMSTLNTSLASSLAVDIISLCRLHSSKRILSCISHKTT